MIQTGLTVLGVLVASILLGLAFGLAFLYLLVHVGLFVSAALG